jgi:hypothetical protein
MPYAVFAGMDASDLPVSVDLIRLRQNRSRNRGIEAEAWGRFRTGEAVLDGSVNVRHRDAREEVLPLPSRTHPQNQKQTSAVYTEELTDLAEIVRATRR